MIIRIYKRGEGGGASDMARNMYLCLEVFTELSLVSIFVYCTVSCTYLLIECCYLLNYCTASFTGYALLWNPGFPLHAHFKKLLSSTSYYRWDLVPLYCIRPLVICSLSGMSELVLTHCASVLLGAVNVSKMIRSVLSPLSSLTSQFSSLCAKIVCHMYINFSAYEMLDYSFH